MSLRGAPSRIGASLEEKLACLVGPNTNRILLQALKLDTSALSPETVPASDYETPKDIYSK